MLHKTILLVHPSIEMMGEIKHFVEDALSEDGFAVSLDWDEDVAGAVRRIEKNQYDLIIARSDIPSDKREIGATAGQQGGIDLLRWLRKDQDSQAPFVIIRISKQTKGDEADGFDNVRSVYEGSGLFREIVDSMRAFFKFREERETPKRVDIDLTISGDISHCQWVMRGINVDGVDGSGSLTIDKDDIEDFKERSKDIDLFLLTREVSRDRWKSALLRLGHSLTEKIIEEQPEFVKHIDDALRKLDGRSEKVRIRFIVEEQVHPIALEALLRHTADKPDRYVSEDHWMLRSPIYRRLVGGEEGGDTLFQDPERATGPMNCLIIQANVQEVVNVPGLGKFPPLDNAEQEARNLRKFLMKNREPFSIGVVKIIGRGAKGRSFGQEVEGALRDRRENPNWHIVHFAGHTYFDEATKKGFFLLPDHPVEIIDASTFAMWLRECEVRLMYLSSCRSSAEGFVFQLTREHVPAVVGFRWDLPDQEAAGFAERFYKHLFDTRSLEYGFLETRKEMYYDKKYQERPIWASPVLVMQEKR